VREMVQSIVDEVNSRYAPVEQVREFRMLPKELDHEDGELTATQKVRRAAVVTLFEDLVDDVYAAKVRG
jgi:long-chain acyl-CoA synthetase